MSHRRLLTIYVSTLNIFRKSFFKQKIRIYIHSNSHIRIYIRIKKLFRVSTQSLEFFKVCGG